MAEDDRVRFVTRAQGWAVYMEVEYTIRLNGQSVEVQATSKIAGVTTRTLGVYGPEEAEDLAQQVEALAKALRSKAAEARRNAIARPYKPPAVKSAKRGAR